MSEADTDGDLNERGNHEGAFTQGVGGWAEYRVHLTKVPDVRRHDVTVPPGKVIPVVFLPGVMGSNLRMSKTRQEKLERADNRAWRPDDLVSATGQAQVAGGYGFGGWYRDATPAQRQQVFDPDETEVEYYHYTQSKDRFDPEGKETLAADARHQNVPDNFKEIPPLLGQRGAPPIPEKPGSRGVQRKSQTPAQVARWRGWSEVLFDGAYGVMLRHAERYLNNMIDKTQVHAMWRPLFRDPKTMGALGGTPLAEADIQKIAPCWYPVHALGYNFLKSNGESAKVIASRIRNLVKGYKERNFQCDEVIIVTHSMGGVVARALLHPSYGNLLADETVKVLGMYHNVMPSMGAAAAYKRMRFGFLEKAGQKAELKASVIAIDGEHATAILANTPGPLELLPGSAYGKDWLKVVDGSGDTVWSWPRDEQTALDSIYLQPDKAWWRLVNPRWVNPANRPDKNNGINAVFERIKFSSNFMRAINTTFHPSNSYASYCDSKQRQSYGEVVFKILDSDVWHARDANLPPPESWQLVDDDAKGTLRVRAGARVMTLRLQPANASGDETVPADRSARKVQGLRFVHGAGENQGYEHQDSLSNQQVLDSMLYAIAQIAKTAKWG